MTSTGHPRGFGSDSPIGSGRARGSLHLIYETCECGNEASDIHKFPWVDGGQWDPRVGASHIYMCGLFHSLVRILN